MLVDTRPTVRLPRISPQQRAILAQVAEARQSHDFTGAATVTEHYRVLELRNLAAEGRLAGAALAATPAWRSALCGAAFAIAWPVVFSRLSRKVEIARGHVACAASVLRMQGDCLDGFYDDVEAVVTDLLTHATIPIRSVEGWVASRINASTIDAHRRRRGQLGALQRPRLPRWLSEALGDPWLVDLAVQMLNWVGVRCTAGAQLWPLDSWVLRRVAFTGDAGSSDAAQVGRDIETVLAAMRARPDWYLSYMERPLGHKQPPVTATDDAGTSPLLLTDPAQTDDTHLLDLADQALRALAHRFTTAQDPASAVREVLRTVFGSADVSHDLDRRPLDAPDYEQHLVQLLEDSGRIDLVVTAVRQALRDGGSTAAAGREEVASPAPHERRSLPTPRRPIRGRRLPIAGPRHLPC